MVRSMIQVAAGGRRVVVGPITPCLMALES